MKTKITAPGHSFENSISKEEMNTLAKFFVVFTPGFVKDGIGILNDNVKIFRIKNVIKRTHEANEELKLYGAQIKPLPIKESLLYLDAASLEEDETLQKSYSKLLANAGLNSNNMIVYLSILKELTPADAKVLQYFYKVMSSKDIKYPKLFRWSIAKNIFSENNEEARISFDNLLRHKLLEYPEINETYDGSGHKEAEKYLQPSSLGRAFILACNEINITER